MAVKTKRGLRVNYLIIVLSGILLLATAVLVFLLVVKGIYGNYEIDEILPSKDNIETLAEDKQRKAALLYSGFTENMMEPGSTWLSDNISAWENFLTSIRMPYDIIDDQDIEQGEHLDYKILVLPGSKSLSDKELLQIKRYIERGGSVFSTGGPATFSDEGKWRGWNFVTEVFGLKFNKEIDPTETYKVHTLRGNLPITANIPTGYALKIATWDRPIYMEVMEPRTTQVSFWYDFRHEAGLVREEIKKSAGIAYGKYGRGRFVWYGFEITSVIGEQEDYVYFERLFQNSISWLTYGPTAFVKDWPAPYKAALIFVPTLDDDLYNASNIANALSGQRVPATIFVDPQAASLNRRTVRSLGRYGNFGAIVDVGFQTSVYDTLNRLYDNYEQLNNVTIATDTLAGITGSDVISVMPSYGYYDENTLRAMIENDIDFLLTDSLTDRSVPKIVIRDENPLMIITKTARDDYEIIGEYGLTERNFQQYTYEEDIDRLLFEGGLYVFKVHSRYQLRAEYVSVVNDVLKYAKSKGMWLTSLPELWNWWFRRSGVEIVYESRSKRRIVVEVNNPRDTKSENIVVQLNLNKRVRNLQISSDIINTKIPEYNFNESTNTLHIYLEELDAGESRSYLVDFENVDEV